MNARELYYNAVVRKSQRDNRNPYAEAAAVGITRGVQGALDANTEMKKNVGKYQFDTLLEGQKRRASLVEKILTENDVLYKNKPATPLQISQLYDLMISGEDDTDFGLKPKVKTSNVNYTYPNKKGDENDDMPIFTDSVEGGDVTTNIGTPSKPFPWESALGAVKNVAREYIPGVKTALAGTNILNRKQAPVQSQTTQQNYKVGQVINTPKGNIRIVGFDTDGTPLIEKVN